MEGYLQNEFVIHYETEPDDSKAAQDMANMRFQKQKTPILIQSHTEQLQAIKEKDSQLKFDDIPINQSNKKEEKILYEQPEILKAGEKPGQHQDQNTEIVKSSAKKDSNNSQGWSVPEMKGSKQDSSQTQSGGLIETNTSTNTTPSQLTPTQVTPSQVTPSQVNPTQPSTNPSSSGQTDKYEAVDIVKAPSVVVSQSAFAYQTATQPTASYQIISQPNVVSYPSTIVHHFAQAPPTQSIVQQKLAPILNPIPIVSNLNQEPYQPRIVTTAQPTVTSSQLIQQELALSSQQVVHIITPQEEQIQYNENQEKIERNHEQLQQTFDYISHLSTHLDSYQAISNFQNKLHHMQNALKIHNVEVSDMISQNYQILEALYTQIIQVKEELVQIDVAQQKFQQIDDKLDEIENQKKGLETTKKILELIKTVPKQQQSSYPSIITQYGSLYSQIYENHLPVVQNEAPEIVIEKMLKSNLIVQLSVPTQCDELQQFTDIIKNQSEEQDHIEKLFSDDKQKELLEDEKEEEAEEKVYQSRINIINQQIQNLVNGLQHENQLDQQQQVNVIHVLGEQELNNDIAVLDSKLDDEESSSSSSCSSDDEDVQKTVIQIHPNDLNKIDDSNFHVAQQLVTNESEEESSSSSEEQIADNVDDQDLNDVYNGKYDREVLENQHEILLKEEISDLSDNDTVNENEDATEQEQEETSQQEETTATEQEEAISTEQEDANEQEESSSTQFEDASSTEIEEANEEAQKLLDKVKKLAESEAEEEDESSSSDSENEDEVITLKLKKSKDGFDVVDNNNVTISSKQLKTVISSLNKGKKTKQSKKVIKH